MPRRFSCIRVGGLFAVFFLFAGAASADAPVMVLNEDVAWRSIGTTGVEVALLTGDPAQAGPYSMMIKVPEDGLWQPDTLSSDWHDLTLVSGTLVWVTGGSFEDGSMTALAPGGFSKVPTAENQHGWAWNSDVVAIVTAMGPSRTASIGDD